LLARQGAYAALHDAQFADAPGREVARVEPGEAVDDHPVTRPAVPRPGRPVAGRAGARLIDAWYGGARWIRLLTPLSWVFRQVAERRRVAYLTGRRTVWHAPVPVVVVGNVTVGGTGKTPLVIWLARHLQALGHRPGIVSRGYGGASHAPRPVSADSDPVEVGDEPVLIAARTGCPVWVGRDRAEVVRRLLAESECSIVIADDGLQHYQLGRDVEIAVVDGERLFGNGLCLPAGPLREPVERLAAVDWQVSNGRSDLGSGAEAVMQIVPQAFVDLMSGERLDPGAFVARYPAVRALAGIGNPARFAVTLADLGLDATLLALPDHHRYSGVELGPPADPRPVVCTEKDAVKLRRLPALRKLTAPGRLWALEVDVVFEAAAVRQLDEVLHRHGIGAAL
jgi:tetraacyldisaccharide 4'-kinase